MSVFSSLLTTLRDCGRARTILQLEILALRHQLRVLERSHGHRLRLTRVDRLLGSGSLDSGLSGVRRSSSSNLKRSSAGIDAGSASFGRGSAVTGRGGRPSRAAGQGARQGAHRAAVARTERGPAVKPALANFNARGRPRTAWCGSLGSVSPRAWRVSDSLPRLPRRSPAHSPTWRPNRRDG